MYLIVLDDDEAMAGFMATVAERRGWTVQAATRESEFQALVRETSPDAIMLDLQLGVSDGIEQLHFLHGQGYAGAVVLMSGFDVRVLASAQQIGDSLGLTIAAVIEKPARVQRVREVLDAIEQRQAAAARPMARHDGSPAKAGGITATEIGDGITAGQMALYLQPIVTAAGQDVARAEALIRWQHPVLGMVLPDRFIPVAETDARVIDQLTMWVAETGVTHYRRLAEMGSPIQICINISGCNLRSLDFPDRMGSLLARMSVPRGAIALEITESVAMHDLDATTAILTRLRLKGFPVAIDDFGTGHSSLTALRRMPFSTIKIDKSFVGELQTSSDSLTIVRSVIQLARDMRLASVAEGVETLDAVQLLTELGIDSLQGYHFSRPLPFDGFASWLKDWAGGRVAVEA